MKKLPNFLWLFILPSLIVAQELDPDLFQTWYFTSITTEFDGIFNTSDIDPPITPFLTITESLDFTGLGSCNTFDGTWIYDPQIQSFISENFEATFMDCENSEQDLYEDKYFSFFEMGSYLYYQIETISDTEQKLNLDSPLFAGMDFTNNPLSVEEYNKNEFKIFPNPASDRIYIQSDTEAIDSFFIFTVQGQRIIEKHGPNDYMDVSSLASGMYLLEITSAGRKSIQKFIKQ